MMKNLRSLVGLAAATLILCSTAAAQQPGQPNQQYQPPPVPKTKIAILNLQQVVKSYEKWKVFEEEYKRNYKSFDAEFEKIKTEGLKLKDQLAKEPPDSPNAEAMKRRLKELDRMVQDLGDNAKSRLLKLQDDMSIRIYQEVEACVGAYARANDIDLVMQFNDGVQPSDKNNPANIQRKMQTGACMPMFWVDGMDISPTIIIMLNNHYSKVQQTPNNQTGQRESSPPLLLRHASPSIDACHFRPGLLRNGRWPWGSRSSSFNGRGCRRPTQTFRDEHERAKDWLSLPTNPFAVYRSRRYRLLDGGLDSLALRSGAALHGGRLRSYRFAAAVTGDRPRQHGERHTTAHHARPAAGSSCVGRTRSGSAGRNAR